LAIASYQRALAIKPTIGEALANLGAAYLAEGLSGPASRELSLALASSPELDEAISSELEAKIEHNLAAARSNLEKKAPASVEAPTLLARLKAAYPSLKDKMGDGGAVGYERVEGGYRPQDRLSRLRPGYKDLKPRRGPP